MTFYPADMRWFNNHPRYGETYIMQAYNDEVERAKESIVISNAYFVPSENTSAKDSVQGLKDAAAKRCVDVTILTNAAEASDGPSSKSQGRSFYKDLLESNTEARTHCGRDKLQIIEWQGQWHGEYTNHAKFAVFDRKEVIVGSFNLDPRSVNLNSETVP